MTNDDLLDRIIGHLIKLPGSVKIGRTSDTDDRYACWFPHDDEAVYIRWISSAFDLSVDSSISSADFGGASVVLEDPK